MSDKPIEPVDYISGVKVVDFGDMRVARGMTRRPYSSCKHRKLTYDQIERRIWCSDCEKEVEPFDAFTSLVEYYDGAMKDLMARQKRVQEAEAFSLRSLAAKHVDQAWRSRTMVPACPHCGHGLFPESFKDGVLVTLGREYAEARLKRKNDTPR